MWEYFQDLQISLTELHKTNLNVFEFLFPRSALFQRQLLDTFSQKVLNILIRPSEVVHTSDVMYCGSAFC